MEFKNLVLIWLQALLDVEANKVFWTQSPSLHCLAILSSVLISFSGKPSPIASTGMPKDLGLHLILLVILGRGRVGGQNSFYPTVPEILRMTPICSVWCVCCSWERKWVTLNVYISIAFPVLEPEDDFSPIRPQTL